jgi:hypothetical protein
MVNGARGVYIVVQAARGRHAQIGTLNAQNQPPHKTEGSHLKFLQHLVRCRSGYMQTRSTLRSEDIKSSSANPRLALAKLFR